MVNRPDDPLVRFRAWVDNDVPPEQVSSSLRTVIHHVDTFWSQRERDNVALFHYSDLEADLVAEMQRLAAVLEHRHLYRARTQSSPSPPASTR